MLLLHCRRIGLVIWVLTTFGRLLDRGCFAEPLPLVKDGDLAAIAMYMIQARGQDTVWGH